MPHPARPASAKPARAWQRMLSGRRLDLLDPSPMDVEIEDIAHGLARVARWNGQTVGAHAFSVAQHSILVADLAGDMANGTWTATHRLTALLHDAAEYVIGDMISPFKAALGGDYRAVEARLSAAIHIRFGLPAQTPGPIAATIKRADKAAAYLEATQLAGFAAVEARRLFGAPPSERAAMLEPWSAGAAQAAFLDAFAAAQAQTQTDGGS